ncbi:MULTISPECIES: DUF2922 domain-containing protein [Dictyoglomus]|jgi:hypothetical protein|uniref:DUF2922 domain-containing protein n=1 Tax=Dictyoglomus turgidum (strain DSM 6724 / Z-1310) TaxID=515635 RepID=B8E1Y6_DICTD|nr:MULTISPECIES: DUF2922 domain-containing protein [Dictyoglomus]ACK41769.1 conserved hypothetical protein [Dictyoglomus turgidum DSM 6724]PNV79104.1 MAG: DUF2922 domain-containing protein [Dictyoglomus turgidum]HBU31551.1 DUF2922 domain-containing protein [Dictyoglomus sp.]
MATYSSRRYIRMIFKDSGGSNFTIRVPEPKDNITEQEILNAMDIIISQNIFQGRSGDLVEKVDARVIETNISDYYD